VFSIPMFLHVPEPAMVASAAATDTRGALRTAFARLARTLHDLRHMRDAGLFLLAFLLYNDGIGTIMRMAVSYGAEIGIGRSDLITAVLLVQFIGIPCALAFGWLAQKTSAKSAILLSLAVYIAISVLAWRMRTREHFYMLACGVALVQGGSQALSRSVFASMVPRTRSAEFFGLFAVLEKFAGVLGPAMFYAANQWLGSSRIGVGLVVLFFVFGAALLWKVDVAEGQRAAREVDAVPDVVPEDPASAS
jgi:UMF1 family MFS transporter